MKILFLLAFSYCGLNSQNNSQLNQTEENDTHWLQKTSRVLRGKTLTPEEVKELKNMKSEQVIDQFMKDELFVNSLLQFNLFYWGLLDEDSRTNLSKGKFDNYTVLQISKNMSTILNGALEVFNSKNFRKIYHLNQDQYSLGRSQDWLYQYQFPDHTAEQLQKVNEKGDASRVDFVKQEFYRVVALLKGLIDAGDSESIQKFCSSSFDRFNLYYLINFLGGRSSVFEDNLSSYAVYRECNQKSIDIDKLRRAFADYNSHVVAEFNFALKYLTPTFFKDIKSFSEIKNLSTIDKKITGKFLDQQIWYQSLQNSSTNMNRKRSAYVLKTFFCDDMTPVDLGTIGDLPHGGNAHASDPRCVTCHYRLDPMAGFFRNIGFMGVDFKHDPVAQIYREVYGAEHIFDDGKQLNKSEVETYLKNWPKSGYIRSRTQPEKNIYEPEGDERPLQKLFNIAAKSYDAQKCLTRRLAEFYVAPNIAYDQGWLNELTDELDVPDEESGAAVKKIIKKLLLSKSFGTRNPVQGQCYDRQSGEKPGGNDVPCEVRHTIETNCSSCHGKNDPEKGVDMETWKKLSDGKFGFVIQRDGKELSSTESRKLILDSLVNKDLDKRMPYKKFMSDSDRDRLIKFFEN